MPETSQRALLDALRTFEHGKVVTARLTPGAHLHGNTVIYPPPSGSGHAPAHAQATVPRSIA